MDQNLQETDIITDASLIENCLRGHMESYRTLYSRYSDAMFQTALRIVTIRADAEDILQEAFMDAFTSLRKLRNPAAFAGWLKTTVIHKSINHLQRSRKDSYSAAADWPDDTPEPDGVDEKDFQFRVEAIQEAITRLPPQYRTVVNLHIFEKMSFEEIARLLETPSTTIRSHYFRARQKLLSMVKNA